MKHIRYSRVFAATALVALAAGLGPVPPAEAQDGADLVAEDGRFQIERVGEDVLRLDRASGKVELCVSTATTTPTFACRTVIAGVKDNVSPPPASGDVLAENQALRQENERLKQRLAMIAALVEDIEADATPARDLVPLIPPVAKREIDQAVEVTTYAVRRFRDLVESLVEEENRSSRGPAD